MNKEIDKMAEKVEEKKCMWPLHADVARAYVEQDKEEAQKKTMEDESDSNDEDEESSNESDVEIESETEGSRLQSKNDAVKNKNSDNADDLENVVKEEGSSEMEPKVNDVNGDSEANNGDPQEIEN